MKKNEQAQSPTEALTPKQQSMQHARQFRKGISDEGRERCREAAQRARNWEKSTGPRTEAGKARSKMNALKHGLTYTLWRLRDERAAINRWLSDLDLDEAHEQIRQAVQATSQRAKS